METKVYMGGKEMEVKANINLDDKGLQRKAWCEEDLASFFRSTGCGIKDIEYFNLIQDDNPLGEMLRVYFDEEHHCYKQVWITGDSRAAIVEDMFRQRAVY